MASTGSSSKYLLYFVGILLLIHSGYSAFEFHKYAIHYNHHLHHQHQHQHQHQHGSNTTDQSISLPLDIYIEAIVGFIIVMVGAIASIENPVHLSIDDKVIVEESKYLRPIELKDSLQLGERVGINAFTELESRVAFIDIVSKRKEYEDWVNKEKLEI
ncbi:hypothetical protein CANMA_001632 [Candida margitis]|uniref:uncharacterized protein n=1 Tax=Candida margitis TaxID=1775924 RepID=UPI0022269FF2|nr:uncharacterized protein CANMA_001632 [Candida margitis]KAI5969312.1 hypothetical protein CANMA_001632 [Candida margitis]